MKIDTKYKNKIAFYSSFISPIYLFGKEIIPHKFLYSIEPILNQIDKLALGVIWGSNFYFIYRKIRAEIEMLKQPNFKNKILKAYEQFDGLIGSPSNNSLYRKKLVENLIDNINPNDKNLVSLGGGSGKLENELVNQDFNVINVDISPKTLERCNNKNSNIKCIVADAENLPFREKCIDVAINNVAIGHLDPYKTFKETYRILKENSTIQMSTYANTKYNRVDVFTSLYKLYPEEELTTALIDSGFDGILKGELMSTSTLHLPLKMIVFTAKK